jgi:tripeptide aminopeptidase
VAAILEVLRTLKEKKLPHPPLRIVFTVAEEIGLSGAKALPAKAFAADFGLVIDGGDINEIVTQAPTQYSLNATVTGRAAHAGLRPEEGINAIKVASQAIVRMRLGRIAKDTTANIGLIEGGTATNIVPERAEIKGEARSHNEKKLKKQVQQMEKALFDAGRRSGAQVRIRIERAYKAFSVGKESEPVALALRVIKNSVIKKTGGGSDANIFNERGVPSIILGVGADKVHTTKENLPVGDFVLGTENLLNIIREASAWQNSKKKK